MHSLPLFLPSTLFSSLRRKLLFLAFRAGAAEEEALGARRNQVPSSHTPGGVKWVAVRARGRGGRASDRRSAAVAQPVEDDDSLKRVCSLLLVKCK